MNNNTLLNHNKQQRRGWPCRPSLFRKTLLALTLSTLTMSAMATSYPTTVTTGPLNSGDTVATTVANADGVYSSAGTIDISGLVTISTIGQDANGISIASGGIVNVNGDATITTTNNGVVANDASKPNFIGSNGILVNGAGAQLNASNGTLTINTSGSAVSTSGAGNNGIAAIYGGALNAHNVDITTVGNSSLGIGGFDGSTIAIDGLTKVTTSGDHGYGIDLGDDPSTPTGVNVATFGDVDVTTHGVSGLGLVAQVNSTLTVNGKTTINTEGQNAHGIRVVTGGVVNLNGLTINTTGQDATGVSVSSGGIVNLNGDATINTSNGGVLDNFGSAGLYASDAGSTITSTGTVTINTTGGDNVANETSEGIRAENGATIQLNNAIVTTTGDYANALQAIDPGAVSGASVTITGNYITNTSGLLAIGALAGDGAHVGVVSLGTADITTSGTQSYGLASLAIGSTLTVLGQATVNTSGQNANGVHATKGGLVNLNGPTTINTTGQGAIGVYADGASSQVIATAPMIVNTSGVGIQSDNAGSIELNNATVSTTGLASYGLYANNGSQIVAHGLTTVATNGDHAYGVVSYDSQITLDDVTVNNPASTIYANGLEASTLLPNSSSTINVNGTATINIAGGTGTQGGAGVAAFESGSTVNVANAIINTTGDLGHGLYEYDGGVLNVGTATVTTAGANAYGIDARGGPNAGGVINVSGDASFNTTGDTANGINAISGGVVTLAGNAIINTTGDNANGVLIDDTAGDSSVVFSGSQNSIHTSGINAHGIAMVNDSGVNPEALNNINVAVTGAGSDALNIDPDQTAITMGLSNTQLSSAQGNAITTIGGNRTFNLTNSSLTALAGAALSAQTDATSGQASLVNLNLSNSQMTGAIITDAASTTNVVLDATSTWNTLLVSNVDYLDNAGTINYGKPVGGVFSTITTKGDYVGRNGLINFTTQLGDDNSPTSELTVQGNTSGNTNVKITNAGGSGAKTADGIKIIDVSGDSAGQFSLVGRAVAGAYEYNLFQGTPTANDGNWYLRSTGMRPEAGVYVGNRYNASTLFLQTMNDRYGTSPYVASQHEGKTYGYNVWGKVKGDRGSNDMGNGSLTMKNDSVVAMIGGDLIYWQGNNSRFHGGLMFSTGRATSKASVRDANISSNGTVTGNAFGIYGTWFASNENKGLYIDSWVQYGWYNNKVNSDGFASQSYRSHSLTESLEAGYAIPLTAPSSEQWFIEPQVQAIFNQYSQKGITDDAGTVINSESNNSVTTRLGARLYGRFATSNKHTIIQPTLTLNWWHGAQQGDIQMDNTVIQSGVPKDRFEAKVGLDVQLSKNVHIWANIGAQMGKNHYKDTTGQIGIDYRF